MSRWVVGSSRISRFGGFDYYKEKLAEEETAASGSAPQKKPAAPGNAVSPQAQVPAPQQAAGKDRRREKAAKRNALLPEKRRIERGLAKCEKIIEDAENEKAEIDKQLMAATPQTDFASLQKRRKSLDYDIAEATVEWERLASEHEEFMKKYNADDAD